MCLYLPKAAERSQWAIYTLAGGLVASPQFSGGFDQCWSTHGLAPGLYFVRLVIAYGDGTQETRLQKVAIVR